MKINYTPIRADHSIKIDGEIIYIKQKNGIKKVDFTNVADGKMVDPIDFIPFAERVNGELTITLQQPVDRLGNPIDQDDFDVTGAVEVEIPWKTQAEIDEENNAPQPPTQVERIAQLEEESLIIMLALAELHGLILGGE